MKKSQELRIWIVYLNFIIPKHNEMERDNKRENEIGITLVKYKVNVGKNVIEFYSFKLWSYIREGYISIVKILRITKAKLILCKLKLEFFL